ncbi:hypothetical protein SNOG_04501 [Parastagonospora nodorum SN15]|uniref:Uncharacterized protein n=1 Tax=Phaeosphaeria nodorum (strain SN15 / ATCC MYA-4574 / FGSC 10173) TaxID=321614 RepID=Q0UUR3_PHANO|nr:hypothetical protein SNOG_04501 [Parastagonospora nodorum SN15]EAT88261.1 hypothetical protein SNOG_04501 [Parastagonospora nodorum SN15]
MTELSQPKVAASECKCDRDAISQRNQLSSPLLRLPPERRN